MKLESKAAFHQLYIKSLQGLNAHQDLLMKHEKGFDETCMKLEKLVDYKVLPLEDQVRVQTAMILSGLNN